MKRARRYRYVMGDSSSEASRLRAQARLWDPVAKALFTRLGVGKGQAVLEVGPGQGSLHLELRRRVGGPIDAVERSSAFADRLKRLCARDGYGAGRLFESDLETTHLPRDHYDLIFARWVFLFLPDPKGAVRKLARALKPGGRLAIEDYHREGFALLPRPAEWTDFLAADRAFFASEGGDASVGGRLPGFYGLAGLDVVEIRPELKWGHPGSPVWGWLSRYYRSVEKRYASFPPFSREKSRRLRRAWGKAKESPSSLAIAPTVLDVVGRKR
jgi:ubiquinone/menaquinone biosynthesis C-methylase UbiE